MTGTLKGTQGAGLGDYLMTGTFGGRINLDAKIYGKLIWVVFRITVHAFGPQKTIENDGFKP